MECCLAIEIIVFDLLLLVFLFITFKFDLSPVLKVKMDMIYCLIYKLWYKHANVRDITAYSEAN